MSRDVPLCPDCGEWDFPYHYCTDPRRGGLWTQFWKYRKTTFVHAFGHWNWWSFLVGVVAGLWIYMIVLLAVLSVTP